MKKTLKKPRLYLDLILLLVFDVLAFVLSLAIASDLMYSMPFSDFVHEHTYFSILLLVTCIVSVYFLDLYYVLKDFRRYRKLVNLILANIAAFLVIIVLAFWDRSVAVKRLFLVIYFLSFFTIALVSRIFFSLLRGKVFYKKALIFGVSPVGGLVLQEITSQEEAGHSIGIEIEGFVGKKDEHSDILYSGLKFLGNIEELKNVVEDKEIDLIIYALDETGESKANEMIIHEKLKGTDLISAVALCEAISGLVPYEYVNSSWIIEDCLRSNKFTEIKIKRALDLAFGLLFFIISLPLILLVSGVLKVCGKGPVFFVQERIGRFGRPFKMYKFCTMIKDNKKNDKAAPEGWYQKNEERITTVGHFLRKTHLDELPQLINVVKGDMSVVGPRPEMDLFTRMCEEKISFYRLRLAVRPGITGWAQIWYSHTSSLVGYRTKFKYDLYYLANISLRLDMEIMIRTVFRMFGFPRIKQNI